ncbi:FkbM family methyltransferase [Sphingomonas sp. 1P06PA]|uniref:FkbM family methyltransferase n=1 Tax=Sphingomonas sp. 1P06PA TaxID=554121 RepID=UPI0039A5485E
MAWTERFRALARNLAGPRHHAQRVLQYELAHGEPELALIPLLCDDAHDFLDVGANDGAYALHALGYCRHVYAVEANPALAAPLRRVLAPRGTVVAKALSDHEGMARLSIPMLNGRDVATRSSLQGDANPGFASREVDVPLTTIDALGLDAVNLVKIDVEGHELAVLQGGRATLDQLHPICIVECEERHNVGGVARMASFFSTLGYQGHFLHRGALRPFEAYDPATFQRVDQIKGVGAARSADYVNNFIFAHPASKAAIDRVRAAYPASLRGAG